MMLITCSVLVASAAAFSNTPEPPELMTRMTVQTAGTADAASISMCTNTCNYASDGGCDDGGTGSTWLTTFINKQGGEMQMHLCSYGTDCEDCGARGGFSIKAHTHDDFAAKDHGHGKHYHNYYHHMTNTNWATVGRRLNEDLKSTVVNDQTIGDLMDAVKSLKAEIEEMQKAELARELATTAEIEEMQKAELATKAEIEEMQKAELATKAELAALKDEIEEMKKDGLTTAEMK